MPSLQYLENLYITTFLDVQRNCASRLTIDQVLSFKPMKQEQSWLLREIV